MSQQAQELDERGRPIHRMSSRRSAAVSMDRKYEEQWNNATIDKEQWGRFAAAALQGILTNDPNTPDAARIAKMRAHEMYIELMNCERGELD